ncbi:hypothetical protein RISK_005821 [Rhodopirellula islandica]|uniref:Uncharacterized protein n=1 Tax=Rhodopirellula islandica TaxID=595434 RepID=A0A0J1B6P2_RHOIS|nr:hypothetical protein RISK_005821 [Rhodopirellula islandica]
MPLPQPLNWKRFGGGSTQENAASIASRDDTINEANPPVPQKGT